MSIGSDFASSVTGNIETALLVIHDYRGMANTSAEARLGQAGNLKALAELRRDATADALKTGQTPTYPGSQDKVLKVQFNPSQLTLNSSAMPKSRKDATSGSSRTMAVEDARLNLTVRLYFDDMDTFDAFMWEKFTSGLSVKGVANAVKLGMDAKGKESKPHTVQWQVESLISALRNPYTRTISFRWADFAFIGQLNAVYANYTMFSTSGRPVRAEVVLRIRHEMDAQMLHHWYKNFEKAFGGDTGNLVKTEQNYSALLNLSL